jgi:hypothetical protein
MVGISAAFTSVRGPGAYPVRRTPDASRIPGAASAVQITLSNLRKVVN